jgi:DNA (cytosine-5)-methyltransferase 1
VLENVKSLLTHDGGRTWDVICAALVGLAGYTVTWQVMNTKDFGIPQSRHRLYIVGLRDSAVPFTFPPPSEGCSPQMAFVDMSDRSTPEPRGTFAERARALQPALRARGCCFVDILQYRSVERIPQRGLPFATCLLCSSYVWCVPAERWANTKELLRLQGFPDDYRIATAPTIVRRQVGNAMSVNVLEALFARLLGVEDRLTRDRVPYTTTPPP